ncbi:hypothetical protein F5Y16DRAFT_411277 [Xylariaceae sp. FL0255]|nr:hypothetical protein F5Y16DRAFT_411277 [Xylariaceae sp. FL0255]
MSFTSLPDDAVELGVFANPNEVFHETPFVVSWDEIRGHSKSLEVIYEEDGYLSALKLTCTGRTSQFGNPPRQASEISRVHKVEIDPGSWVEGFDLTLGDPIESREAGPIGIVNVDIWICSTYRPKNRYHRLFVPANGNALAGVRGSSKGERINSFALIQDVNDELTCSLKWLNTPPPPHASDRNKLRMEALLFGNDKGHKDSQTTADKLVRIAASGDSSRIELTFSSGDSDDVSGGGRNTVLASIEIDGLGGEIITLIIMPPMLEGGMFDICGRQAIFGEASSLNKACIVKIPPGFTVVGLFVSPAFMFYWTIGVLIAPTTSSAPTAIICRDEQGRIWDTTALLLSWAPCGPCIGAKNADFRPLDPDATPSESESEPSDSATCLDLTQPVVCIRRLLAAPAWCHLTHLGGFEVEFANGSKCCIGMPLHEHKIPTEEQVDYEDFRAGITTIIVKGPRIAGSTLHASTKSEVLLQNSGLGKEWYPGGGKGLHIAAVHVWGGDYLHGIQFEMENGELSPKWGKAGENLKNGKSLSGIVGLKFAVRQPDGWAGNAPGPVMVQGYKLK